MCADTTFTDEVTVIEAAWLQDVNDLVYKAFSSGATASAVTLNATLTQVSTVGTSAAGPVIKLHRNSGTPDDADFIGQIFFDGEDDGSNQTTYASIEAQIDDVTDTTEDGTLLIKTMTAGTLTTQLDISSAAILVTPKVTIGSGSVAPDGTLHVHTATAGTITANANSDDLVVENSGNGGISILIPDANEGAIYIGSPSAASMAQFKGGYNAGVPYAQIGPNHASGVLIFQSGSGVEAARIDATRNLLIAGTAVGANSVGTIHIFNATAPTGSTTNGTILFSEDVAASSELRVRDEAGNVTTLSPHNFSLFDPAPNEPMPWAYYSRNDLLGKEINVDLSKLVRLVEKLTGEQLIYARDIPKKPLDQDRAERIRQFIEISRAEIEYVAEVDSKITDAKGRPMRTTETRKRMETFDEAKNRLGEIEPYRYPQWLQDRLT